MQGKIEKKIIEVIQRANVASEKFPNVSIYVIQSNF